MTRLWPHFSDNTTALNFRTVVWTVLQIKTFGKGLKWAVSSLYFFYTPVKTYEQNLSMETNKFIQTAQVPWNSFRHSFAWRINRRICICPRSWRFQSQVSWCPMKLLLNDGPRCDTYGAVSTHIWFLCTYELWKVCAHKYVYVLFYLYTLRAVSTRQDNKFYFSLKFWKLVEVRKLFKLFYP